MDRIIEINLKHDAPELSRIVNQYWGAKYEAFKKADGKNSYGRLVYIDGSAPKVIAFAECTYYDRTPSFRAEFKRLLSKIEQKNYWKFLMLSTLYWSKSNDVIIKMLNHKNGKVRKGSFLDLILKESNGYLVYSYQFERIVQAIFKTTYPESVLIRKEFNKTGKVLQLSQDHNYEIQIFNEVLGRSYFGNGLYHPNIDGAKNLFEFYGRKFI